MSNFDEDIRKACATVYAEGIEPVLKNKDAGLKEKIFVENGDYREQRAGSDVLKPQQNENSRKMSYMLQKLCYGKNASNRYLKDFLLKQGYAKENDGRVDLTDKLQFSASQDSLPGSYTKYGKNGIMIHLNGDAFAHGDEVLAVTLGHEITHIMVNEKMGKTGTSTETEALCDTMGIAAAKGADYDISPFMAFSEQAYDEAHHKQSVEQNFELFYAKGMPRKSDKEMSEIKDNSYRDMIRLYRPDNLAQVWKTADALISSARDAEKLRTLSGLGQKRPSNISTKNVDKRLLSPLKKGRGIE